MPTRSGRIALAECGDPGVQVRLGRGEAVGCPASHPCRAAQQERHRNADRQRVAFPTRLGRCGQRSYDAIQPATVHTMVCTTLKVVLRLEVATRAIGAGDGVNDEELTCPIHAMQVRQHRMQSIETAEIQCPAILSRRRRRNLTAQPCECRIPIGDHGGHAVQCPAEDHHDEALFGCRCGQRQ